MLPLRLSALAIVALLSACGGAKDNGPERKTAAGEVLGGSVSDAMLPLATVQSQSPPQRASAVEGGDEDTGEKPDDKSKVPAPSASPEPSSTPAAPASASASAAAEN